MIDFSKRMNKGKIEKKVLPTDIYNDLDRKSEAGPLRPSQERVLKDWYEQYNGKKNTIVKLHTGEGKTLVGLLILLSKMNQNNGPSLYICPNIYLVEQTCLEAEKFGIPYCKINRESNEIPEAFLSSQKILITHVQKVFNGKTIFGLRGKSIDVGTVVLDDSHACIDSIKDAFTIKIPSELPLYKEILELFEEDLCEQGEGTLLDIKSGAYDSLLPIPYWSWINKVSELTSLLGKHASEKEIMYVWPIVKDNIKKCQAYISGNKIEISPIYVPIDYFGSFNNARNRILMSATTQDDSFFIRGLGFSLEEVQKPLINPDLKWSGEKMLIIPSLISEELDRDSIISKFIPNRKREYGVVALTTSFKSSEQYKKVGATIVDTKSIYSLVKKLKSQEYDEAIVFANRYDGIDLPDNSCRVLIVDSKPFLDSLKEKHEEQCRTTSDIINIQIAQKIEQGFGRSVRGEKDYSAVFIIGGDLVSFIKSPTTKKYFSPQTQKQIEIGLKVVEFSKEELNPEEQETIIVENLVKQIVRRDEGWKEFYKAEMGDLEILPPKNEVYEILILENDADKKMFSNDYENACIIVQKICDRLQDNQNEKGWYLQKLAHYSYFNSKSNSNKFQGLAYKSNFNLLKPKEGVTYQKLEYKSDLRTSKIRKYINTFSSYDDFYFVHEGILSNLSFGMDSEKFESALQKIGVLLGFDSQRPDREIRKGPDNLWCIENNSYLLFECKNEVLEKRTEISKNEAGQMNSHCGWFENEYKTANVVRFLVIPTNTLSYYANFTHDVLIIRQNKLKLLKENLKHFIKEFKPYILSEITNEKIDEFITANNLNIESLKNFYSEKYYHKKNDK